MSQAETIDILNRLLVIHHRSLPMYLAEAQPWTHRGDAEAAGVLANIIHDHRAMARRIAEAIEELDGAVEPGEFPMEFTDLNFVALDALLRPLVEHQRETIARIEVCVADLAMNPQWQPLAEEALGAARGHLEQLEDLVQEPSAS